jgi:hypothetical protein
MMILDKSWEVFTRKGSGYSTSDLCRESAGTWGAVRQRPGEDKGISGRRGGHHLGSCRPRKSNRAAAVTERDPGIIRRIFASL